MMSHIFAHWTSWATVTHLIAFIVVRGIMRFLSAVRVNPRSGIILTPRLYTVVPNFVSAAPFIAEQARGENSRIQSPIPRRNADEDELFL